MTLTSTPRWRSGSSSGWTIWSRSGLLTQGVPGVPQDPLAPPSGPRAPSPDSRKRTENPSGTPLLWPSGPLAEWELSPQASTLCAWTSSACEPGLSSASLPGRRSPDGHRIDGCPGSDTQCTRYIDQCPEGEGDTGDIGLELAKTHGVPVYSSINQCLCCGGSELAVDGVIMVGEHGDYPCVRASRRAVWRCVLRHCLCSMARHHVAQCKCEVSRFGCGHCAHG